MRELINVIIYYQAHAKRFLQIFSGVLIILFYNNCGQGFETTLDSGAASSPSVAATSTPEPSASQPDGNMPDVVNPVDIVDNGPNSVDAVLYVDFSNRPVGPYKEADLRKDFQVGTGKYRDSVHGPDWGSLDIANDPTNSGHGKVMRTLRREGSRGAGESAGGFRFRADLPPKDAYYFAYDYYVPADWWQPLQNKLPGLGSGTLLQMSHPAGNGTTVEELEAFSYRMQSYLGPGSNYRGIGALAAYAYDKDGTADPNWLDSSGSPDQDPETPYNMPNDRWITIEQYIHRGTPNKRDGIVRIWIDGQLMLDEKRMILRNSPGYDNSKSKVDGIFMLSFYGGSEKKRNSPPKDQYQYYDNFIVSTSPITH